MNRLPLYAGGKPTALAVETVEPTTCDPLCESCNLRTDATRSPCLTGEGEAGGVLLVGQAPGKMEDATGRPFISKTGQVLRTLVDKWWDGPVAYDLAMRCAPGKKAIKPKHVERCRPYLAATVGEGFDRILCFGAWAALAVTGRKVPPYSTRRGYSFLSNGTPVFYFIPPTAALQNRFVMQWLRDDLEWALTTQVERPTWGATVHVVRTAEDARHAVEDFTEAEWASFDVETSGRLWCDSFDIISCAVAAKGGDDAWVWDLEALVSSDVRAPLEEWLSNPAHKKVAQNAKYDQLSVRDAYPMPVRGVIADTRLVRKLLEPEASAKLDHMAELVGMGGIKQEESKEMKKRLGAVKRALAKEKPLPGFVDDATAAWLHEGQDPERFMYRFLPRTQLTRYNARDAVATTRLAVQQLAALKREPSLQRVWTNIVSDASIALERVEDWGVHIDRVAMQNFNDHCTAGLIAPDVKGELDAYPDINWKSHPQVRKLLFEDLKLRPVYYTDTGQPSTNSATLDILASKHPLAGALSRHRFLTRMLDQYANGMARHVRDDGRIHPNIKLDGARSGRTSCTDPNLQNIPRAKDSPEGKMARDCFIASPGCTLVEFDYSQLELRVAATLSGDPLMRAIFDEGVDYHQRTAEMIAKQTWGISPAQVQPKHRTAAKSINFGILYGMGDRALAAVIGCSKAEAGRIREAIMGKFKVLARWCQEQLRIARKTGYSWTWWDGQRARRRPMFRVASADSAARSRAEHGTWNTPVQGTASDYNVRSLAACVQWIEEDGIEDWCKLVLCVHDSLLFDVRNDLVDEVLATVPSIMSQWPSDGVPLVVDAKVGKAWGSLKDAA